MSQLQLLADAATPPTRGNRVVLRSPLRDRLNSTLTSPSLSPSGSSSASPPLFDKRSYKMVENDHRDGGDEDDDGGTGVSPEAAPYYYPAASSQQNNATNNHNDAGDGRSPSFDYRDGRSRSSTATRQHYSTSPQQARANDGGDFFSPLVTQNNNNSPHDSNNNNNHHHSNSITASGGSPRGKSVERQKNDARRIAEEAAASVASEHEEFLSQVLQEIQLLNEKNRELIEEKGAAVARAETAEASLRETREEMERVRVHHRVLNQTSLELQEELQSVQGQLRATKLEHERCIAQHAAELNEVSSRLAREEAFACSANAELQTQRASLSEVTSREDELHRDLEHAQGRIATAARETSELRERHESKVRELRRFINDLQQRVEAAESKAAEVEKRHKSAGQHEHARVAELETALRNQQEEHRKRMKRQVKLEHDLESAKAQLQSATLDVEKLQSRSCILNPQIEQLALLATECRTALSNPSLQNSHQHQHQQQQRSTSPSSSTARRNQHHHRSGSISSQPSAGGDTASATTAGTRKLPSELAPSHDISVSSAGDDDVEEGVAQRQHAMMGLPTAVMLSTTAGDREDNSNNNSGVVVVGQHHGNDVTTCSSSSTTTSPPSNDDDEDGDDDESPPSSPCPIKPFAMMMPSSSSSSLPPTYPTTSSMTTAQTRTARRSSVAGTTITSSQHNINSNHNNVKKQRSRSESPPVNGASHPHQPHHHHHQAVIENTPVSLLQGANPLFQVQFVVSILRRFLGMRASRCWRESSECARSSKELAETRSQLNLLLAKTSEQSHTVHVQHEHSIKERESAVSLADELRRKTQDLFAQCKETAAVEAAFTTVEGRLEREMFALAETKCQLQEATEKAQHLQQVAAKAQSDKHAVEHQLRAERENVSRLKGDIEVQCKAMAELSEKHDKAKELLSNTLKREQRRYSRALQHADKLEAKYLTAQSELGSMVSKLKIAENEIAEKQRNVQRLEREKRESSTRFHQSEQKLVSEDQQLHGVCAELAAALSNYDRGVTAFADLVYDKTDFRCVSWDLATALPLCIDATSIDAMRGAAEVALHRADEASRMLSLFSEFSLENQVRGEQLVESLAVERERVEFLSSELAVYLRSSERDDQLHHQQQISSSSPAAIIVAGDDDDDDCDDVVMRVVGNNEDCCSSNALEVGDNGNNMSPPSSLSRSKNKKTSSSVSPSHHHHHHNSSSSRRRHRHRHDVDQADGASPPAVLFVS